MKKITIYDLAKECGYSVSTVSKAMSGNAAISEKTADFIKKTAERIGYNPKSAAQMLSIKQKYVAVITPDRPSEYLEMIDKGIAEAEETYFDYPVAFRHFRYGYGRESGEEDAVKAASGCDAVVIAAGASVRACDALKELAKTVPVITMMTGRDYLPEAVNITVDYREIGELAGDIASLIVGKGGVTAVISGLSETSLHNCNVEGFRSAAARCGFLVADVRNSDDGYASIYENALAIAENKDVKAVFVTTSLAVAACDAFLKRDREDIGVIAVDATAVNLAALTSGRIKAVISQNQPIQAKKAIDHAVRRCLKLRGAPKGYNDYIVRPDLIFASGVGYYSKKD